MNHPKATLVCAAALLGASACSSQPTMPIDAAPAAHEPLQHEAMLLVSLDDGTVIMQTIESDASVCFKLNSETATTCLLQGTPLVDPETNAVIGYEMIEETIDLIARTD